ncbi:hypothetical protein MM59RIKEN_28570 [Pusillibacter faecalis]|uniref:Uncharacterized protein n=1 Tax=Pusillibacter faecalis TaxID=2714358 RepID=A0A810QB76_9FIRM|nr:hypothetical protein MM59RIKEN_28570 [Pusillibacter faecalis]
MQSKTLLKRLKWLERKAYSNQEYYLFFGQPRKSELAKVPQGAKVIIFVGEDELED